MLLCGWLPPLFSIPNVLPPTRVVVLLPLVIPINPDVPCEPPEWIKVSWLWLGISLTVNVWVASPPVSPAVYVSPLPSKKVSFICSQVPPNIDDGEVELTLK